MSAIPLNSNMCASQFTPPSVSFGSNNSNGSNEEILQKAIKTKDCKAVDNLKAPFGPLPNGELPLHYSIRKGTYEIVESLLKKGCEINELDSHGLTPTDHALILNDSRMLALIFSYRLDLLQENIFPLINRIPKHALMKSLITGSDHQRHLQLERQRVQKNIDSIMKSCNPTPSGLLKIAGTDFSKKISKISSPEIYDAVLKEEYSKIEDLVAQGKNVNQTTPNGWSALYYAVKQGKTEVVSSLLKNGAKIDLSESAGCSALHIAAASNNVDIVELLLKAGANHSALDKQGMKPLTYAMTSESLVTAKLLAKFSPVTASDVEIMFCSAESRCFKRDQMGIRSNGLQWLLVSSLAIPLLVACAQEKHPVLAGLISYGTTIIPTAVAFAKTKGWKQRAGAITLLALEAVPGINVGVKFAAHAYRTWYIGKESVKTINNCWQHRHLEIIRPFYNSIISGISATYSLSRLYNATQPKDLQGQKKIFCHLRNQVAHNQAVRKGEKTYYHINCDAPDEIGLNEAMKNFSDFYTFTYLKSKTYTWFSNLIGEMTPAERAFWRKKFTHEVPTDLCNGADLKTCIQQTDLKGDVHPSQSMAILGLSTDYTEDKFKENVKKLNLEYHPDKTLDKDSLVVTAVNLAAKYLKDLKKSLAKPDKPQQQNHDAPISKNLGKTTYLLGQG